MPRIIVMTEPSADLHNTAVLLNEHVHSVHLSTDHAATQLVERLAWAISDAESAERARQQQPQSLPRPSRRALPAARVIAGV